MKDLGRLCYFLGVEVAHGSCAIHLTQTKYTIDILQSANMLDCKPCFPLIASKIGLNRDVGPRLFDPSIYCQFVGALQFFNLTRPDISFAVQFVSQFKADPRSPHTDAVKRILRYLKGTVGFDLPLRHAPLSSSLHVYSNVDWANCALILDVPLRAFVFSLVPI
ncbi:uncharacterized mitochondrial protein AtMg00810-like [Prunus dulcis]|uniref:uncharacterized mitochondrial protein AtMg00810-like n=1 Tax=Prunus dulcis TaxID=3755 RepID=UPI001482C2DB|nr:uncharacterized mitochondrial protein AtMg00810-like [Prunus dulcis]